MKLLQRDILALLQHPWIPRGFIGLLGILIVSQVAMMAQYIGQTPEMKAVAMPIASVSALEQQPSGVLNLFGEATLQGSEIQSSQLALDIVGILYAPKPGQSQAILKTSNGEEKNYHIGDQVAQGAVIKKIYQDSIVILYHARLERINLQKSVLDYEKMPKRLFSQ